LPGCADAGGLLPPRAQRPPVPRCPAVREPAPVQREGDRPLIARRVGARQQWSSEMG